MEVFVRVLQPGDLADVLGIERVSFEVPWTDDEFRRCLSQSQTAGLVAEADGRPVGFVIFELAPKQLELLNLAVLPDVRRQGVARALIGHLIERLPAQHCERMHLVIRETNLAAQLFFRAAGFRAVGLLRDYYDDVAEDGIAFQYRRPAAGQPTNRVAKYLT